MTPIASTRNKGINTNKIFEIPPSKYRERGISKLMKGKPIRVTQSVPQSSVEIRVEKTRALWILVRTRNPTTPQKNQRGVKQRPQRKLQVMVFSRCKTTIIEKVVRETKPTGGMTVRNRFQNFFVRFLRNLNFHSGHFLSNIVKKRKVIHNGKKTQAHETDAQVFSSSFTGSKIKNIPNKISVLGHEWNPVKSPTNNECPKCRSNNRS
jgi:hypothetical protein